jgi:glycine/D-amino acid oxidase-like deaminating enzyme
VATYWLEDPPVARPSPRLAGAADVAIVGGGVTGCACALALAEAGRRVRVYDEREIAGGASGRNGGFALRGGAMPYERAREWLGPDEARAYWQLTERYVDRLEELAGDAFRRVGSLRVAADEEERDELLAECEALREDGFAAEWRDDLAPPLESRFAGAIFHPPDGALQPARLVRRLAARAADAGVEIHEHVRVTSLDELEADTVVVATDGYPSGLLGELEGSIIPTRGQMIATEPLAERVFDCPHYGRHGFDYWQQIPDGRVLAGGFRDVRLDSEFTADEVTTEPIQHALEEFVAGLLGWTPRITHRWAGIFGLVLDFMPVVGRVPGREGVWMAGGYSGHGNVLGLMCGELVARALLGDPDPLLELCDPARLLRPQPADVDAVARSQF